MKEHLLKRSIAALVVSTLLLLLALSQGGAATLSPSSEPAERPPKAPVAEESLAFEPAQPVTGDTIRAVLRAEPSSLKEGEMRYRWEVNGLEVQNSEADSLDFPVKRGDYVKVDACRKEGLPGEEDCLSLSTRIGNAGPNVRLAGQAVDAQGLYEARLEAADPEGDPVVFSLREGPRGMQIDPSSGTIRWRVPEAEGADVSVAATVRDSNGAETSLEFGVVIKKQ